MKKSYHLIKIIMLAGSLLLQLSSLCFQSHGAPGALDLSFDPGSGVNGRVRSVAVQPDGKVIIGGDFTTVKGLARAKVARLNPDGSGDTTFGSNTSAGFDGDVNTVALQADGKVIIAGSFRKLVNGFNALMVIRLHTNGSVDNSFDSAPEILGSFVTSLAVQPDGKVLIGGIIATSNGGRENHGIARLNANGSLDNSFDPNGGYSGQYVSSVAVQPDGKVLVGGRGVLTRLNADGSEDSSFNPGTGVASGHVLAIAFQPDGKILVAGEFVTMNGTNRNRIARLHPDGSVDGGFDPGTGVTNPELRCSVESVALQPDGKVLIGGRFSAVNGTNRNGIARLNANGALDTSFNPGSGANSIVTSVAVQPDGKALVGGEFTTLDGVLRTRIARVNADGSLDGSLDPGTGLDGAVASLVVQSDGKAVLGGHFVTVKDLARSRIARLNTDGSGDATFDPGAFMKGSVDVVALLADKVVFAASHSGYKDPYFYNDTQLGSLHSDGTPADYWSWGDQYGGTVRSIAARPDGGLIYAGDFNVEAADGNGGGALFPQPRLLGLGGNVVFNDDPYYGGSLTAAAVQSDGKALIAGPFSIGTTRHSFARFHSDGTLDPTFNCHVAESFGTTGIESIAVQPDGKVLIGGTFATVNGINRFHLARVNADGSLDSSFDPGSGAQGSPGYGGNVASLALQEDGRVLVGGNFSTINGTSRSRIARLNADGSLDHGFNSGAGPNGAVRSVRVQTDGHILIGGDFTSIDGVVRPYVARLYGDGGGPPNIPPAVAISSPAEGSIYAAPATVAISVAASDSDGTITQVDVYVGETLMGSDSSAPFEVTWNNAAVGSYSLTADATDDRGATTTSTPVNITVTTPPPPAAPSDLTARALSSSRIILKWTDQANNELGFKIERRSSPLKPFKQIATVGPDATRFANTGLVPGRKYFYRVRAFNAGGDSEFSNIAKATTLP